MEYRNVSTPYKHISNNTIYFIEIVCLLNNYIYESNIYIVLIQSLFKFTYSIGFKIIIK